MKYTESSRKWGGIFLQPALFEAFGLTILESMQSGLPTFGPIYGCPLEIFEHKKSGFMLDSSKPEIIASGLEEFIELNEKDPDFWKHLSADGFKESTGKFHLGIV